MRHIHLTKQANGAKYVVDEDIGGIKGPWLGHFLLQGKAYVFLPGGMGGRTVSQGVLDDLAEEMSNLNKEIEKT